MRNVLKHEYTAIDLRLVVGAVPLASTGYRRHVTEAARCLGIEAVKGQMIDADPGFDGKLARARRRGRTVPATSGETCGPPAR